MRLKPAVSNSLSSLPCSLKIDGDGVASNAGLWPGDHALLAENGIDQGRLADIRASHHGDAQGVDGCLVLFASLLRDLRATVYAGGLLDEVAQLADADIMLGRDRQRLAEPKGEGFVHACLRRAPLHFVGGDDHRLAGRAHEFGEDLIAGNDPRPRIDQENDKVRLLDGLDSLLAHAGGETRIAMLEPSGIDQPDGARSKLGVGLAPVARQSGLIVDKGEALAGEPVEQRRLADIRPTDDGNGEGHEAGTGA